MTPILPDGVVSDVFTELRLAEHSPGQHAGWRYISTIHSTVPGDFHEGQQVIRVRPTGAFFGHEIRSARWICLYGKVHHDADRKLRQRHCGATVGYHFKVIGDRLLVSRDDHYFGTACVLLCPSFLLSDADRQRYAAHLQAVSDAESCVDGETVDRERAAALGIPVIVRGL